MRQRMEQFNLNSMRLLVGACGLFTIFALTTVGVAQQAVAVQGSNVSATTPATAAPVAKAGLAAKPAEEQEAAAAGKPANEGVKVHGHWVLQVKNVDGTLGERREFDNSLVTTYIANGAGINGGGSSSGAALLAGALTGNVAVGDPAIGFIQGSLSGDASTWCNAPYNSFNYAATPSGITCYVLTTANSMWTGNGPTGLTNGYVYASVGLNTTTTFTPSVSIVLSGNYTVPSGLTQITAVQSLYGACVFYNALAPSGSGYVNYESWTLQNSVSGFNNAAQSMNKCAPANGTGSGGNASVTGALTSAAVTNSLGAATPLPVTAGQIVQVTVTISFS